MIRYLLLLQFPLLYVTSLIAGVGAYWVGRRIGLLYFANLLLLGVLHLLLLRRRTRLSSLRIAVPLLLAGTAAAAWAYRPLHLGSWEVSSIMQIVKLTAVGIASLMASHLATELPPGGKYALPSAVAVSGLLWLPSLHYPLMPLLFAGLIQAVALGFLPLEGHGPAVPPTPSPGRFNGLALYGVFLAGLTIGETVMDYQENSRWATHLVIALLAAALATLLERRLPGRALIGSVAVAAATFLATLLFADFVLHPAHAAGAGLAIGAAVAYFDRRGGVGGLVGPSAMWAFGLALSFGLARHLTIGAWRVLIVVPLLVLLTRALRSTEAAGDS